MVVFSQILWFINIVQFLLIMFVISMREFANYNPSEDVLEATFINVLIFGFWMMVRVMSYATEDIRNSKKEERMVVVRG